MAEYISILITIFLAILFTIIGIILLQKEKRIKLCTQHLMGTVVKYSTSNTRAPVVEYVVHGQKYRKALKYTMTITTSSPFHSVKSSSVDLYDTTLRIRNNSAASFNSLMKDNFPIGSQMKVYYNPNNPKDAYVERYAKNYIGMIFLIGAVISALTAILLAYIFNIL